MSINVSEIAQELGGEQVGNRVIVVHEGRKQYATELGDGGHAFLNELGIELMAAYRARQQPAEEADPVEAAPVEAKPARRKKGESLLGIDSLKIELE
jgi:molybdenum-dependent DNA-binding transcriptional regulator ModE